LVKANLCVKIKAENFKATDENDHGRKKMIDLKEFIASVNKKNKKHNGKKIQFAFVNKKRKP